jgi:hypothetical protein
MLADSGEVRPQSPEPQSVSGDELYSLWEGYATRFSFFLAVYGSVTGKQVGYRICHPHPLIECGHSYRKPCRASWGCAILQS